MAAKKNETVEIVDATDNATWADARAQIVRMLGRTRDADELAQEALCQAWNMARSAAARGKSGELGAFLTFGIRAARSGRKFVWDAAHDISRSVRPVGTPEQGSVRMLGLSQWAHASARASGLDAIIWAESLTQLTPRQRQIIALIAEGHRRVEIARILHLWPTNVSREIKTILILLEE